MELGQAILTDVGSARAMCAAELNVFRQHSGALRAGDPMPAPSKRGGSFQSICSVGTKDPHACCRKPIRSTGVYIACFLTGCQSAHSGDVTRSAAATSHLPHRWHSVGDSLAKRNENLEIFRYAAAVSRFPRIAGSDRAFWHIFSPTASFSATLEISHDLDALRERRGRDGHQCGLFTRARVARDFSNSWPAGLCGRMNSTICFCSPGGRLSVRFAYR